jgi:hypothetical protein
MRARNIKPGLFKTEILATADPLYTLIFEGLWCMADREGRLEDRPRRIHLEVNPGRAYEGTETSLAWLTAQGFIQRYTHGGREYLQIVNFLKHQNPHKREAASEIPPPASVTKGNDSSHGRTSDGATLHTSCQDSSLDTDPTRPRPDPGTAKARSSPADSLFSDSPSLIPDSPSLIQDSVVPVPQASDSSSSPPAKAGRSAAQIEAQAIYMPKDWQPNDVNREWVTEAGMTLIEITTVIDEFVRYWRSTKIRKSPLNWQRTFASNPHVKRAVGAALTRGSSNGTSTLRSQSGVESAFQRAERKLREWSKRVGVETDVGAAAAG